MDVKEISCFMEEEIESSHFMTRSLFHTHTGADDRTIEETTEG